MPLCGVCSLPADTCVQLELANVEQKRVVKRQPSQGVRDGKGTSTGCKDYRGRFGSAVGVSALVLFQHLLFEPPSCPRELFWALVPSTLTWLCFLSVCLFQVGLKRRAISHTLFRLQVKSHRAGSVLHANVGGHCKVLLSSPMVIS